MTVRIDSPTCMRSKASFELNVFDDERFTGFIGDGSFCTHASLYPASGGQTNTADSRRASVDGLSRDSANASALADFFSQARGRGGVVFGASVHVDADIGNLLCELRADFTFYGFDGELWVRAAT